MSEHCVVESIQQLALIFMRERLILIRVEKRYNEVMKEGRNEPFNTLIIQDSEHKKNLKVETSFALRRLLLNF